MGEDVFARASGVAVAALAVGVVLVGAADARTRIGTNAADILRGTPKSDHVYGRGGNDQIFGLGSGDVLTGGAGRDRIWAGPGDDDVKAVDGMRDTIACGRGPDVVHADAVDQIAGDCELVNPQRLTVFVDGDGLVRSTPKRIGCPSACSKLFSRHTLVRLVAEPGPGSTSTFIGWSGACSGTGDCMLRLNAPAHVTASFRLMP